MLHSAKCKTIKSIVPKIGPLSLQRNDSGQYMHAAIMQLKKGIQGVLKQCYNHAGRANDVLSLLMDWSKKKYSYA